MSDKPPKSTMDAALESAFPIRIASIDGRGKGVLAARDLEAGEVILTCNSVSFVPLGTARPSVVCWHCGARPKAPEVHPRCTRCRIAAYCSVEHQRKDWRLHKKECPALLGFPSPPDELPDFCNSLLVPRTVRYMRDAGSGHVKYFRGEEPPIYVHAGADVREMVVEDRLPMDTYALAAVVWIRFKVLDTVHLPDAIEVRARYERNYLRVRDDELLPIGTGLFPAAARFNHSCVPTCIFTYRAAPPMEETSGIVVSVRTLRRVKAGEELTCAYTPIYSYRSHRLEIHREQYNFECNCEMCRMRTDDPRNPEARIFASDEKGSISVTEAASHKHYARFGRTAKDATLTTRCQTACAALDDMCHHPDLYERLCATCSLVAELINIITENALGSSDAVECLDKLSRFPCLPCCVPHAGPHGGCPTHARVAALVKDMRKEDASRVRLELALLRSCALALLPSHPVTYMDIERCMNAIRKRASLVSDHYQWLAGEVYMLAFYEVAHALTPTHPECAFPMLELLDALVTVTCTPSVRSAMIVPGGADVEWLDLILATLGTQAAAHSFAARVAEAVRAVLLGAASLDCLLPIGLDGVRLCSTILTNSFGKGDEKLAHVTAMGAKMQARLDLLALQSAPNPGV